jgi:5-methyltetrahydropteroyltriglutamate--homocysteine methyltransferase
MTRDILTTVVGSYPMPDWLIAHPSEQGLRDAMAVVLKTQEMAGIDLLADGELNRYDINHPETNGAIEYFIHPLTNVRSAVSRPEEKKFAELTHMRFRNRAAGVVEGQIGEGALNLERDFQRARLLTARPLKFTVTSPYMLGRVLLDKHYKTKDALVAALADVLAAQLRDIDAEVVQVNEEILTGNASDASWAAEALNRVFDVLPHKGALYLSFGNYAGQVVQQGSYSALIDFINELHIDHVLLELTRRSPEELAAIKDIKPGIGIGLGVIDVKSTVIETPDEVATAIERIEKVLGPGRLKYVHPDSGFWMHKRSVADGKMLALVKGRDLYLADGGDDESD